MTMKTLYALSFVAIAGCTSTTPVDCRLPVLNANGSIVYHNWGTCAEPTGGDRPAAEQQAAPAPLPDAPAEGDAPTPDLGSPPDTLDNGKDKSNASENNGKGGNDGKGGKDRDGSKNPRSVVTP